MNILLIGVIINASMTVTNSIPCEEGWLVKDGTCFNYYSLKVTWSSAVETCSNLRKGVLATVDSPEINMFVHSNLTEGIDVWIGLNIPDTNKYSWEWSDGNNTLSYNDWNKADVNSACAVVTHDNNEGYWYTSPCTDTRFYICEKEMADDNCSDWLSFDTHCYLIINETGATNMAAARHCWHHDSYLISINGEQEADFIYSKLMFKREYWIGLSPLKWVNDEAYQWNNWGDGGPTHNITNGCVYMDSTSGKWFWGNCANAFLSNEHRSYICQKDAVIDVNATSNVAVEAATATNTALSKSYTAELDALYMSTIPSSAGNSRQIRLTVVVPAVCGGLVAVIVIIVVVIVVRRKRRSSGSKNENLAQTNRPYDITAVSEYDDIENTEHRQNGINIYSLSQENYIYDEAEIVQAENGTIVVNGDVYAIVDKDKIKNPKVQDQIGSQQPAGVSPHNNRKQEIRQGQNHIIVGSDVYAIVNKNNVKLDKQQNPKQKTKKSPPPPKLEDKSEEIKSNGPSHIVVGTDVYAVVDKDKHKPNKQQTSKEKKKNPPAPPKLVDKADAMNEGSVYCNESNIHTVLATPTKHKDKRKNKKENTGVVYADLDLTGSGYGGRQNGNTDEESGVVYADVRG